MWYGSVFLYSSELCRTNKKDEEKAKHIPPDMTEKNIENALA
jgi:hypothetical protein